MVKEGTFRQDLLYRINTVELRMPALAERTEDIDLLVQHFIQLYGKKYQKPKMRIDQNTIAKLKKYHWPGNIRELQHAIERAIILADDHKLTADDFVLQPNRSNKRLEEDILDLSEMEKRLILKALDKNNGNVTRAAKDLGIDRLALYRRLQKYGM